MLIVFRKTFWRSKRYSRGMTFPEVMVVVFVFALLMGGFLAVLTTGFESWRANSLKNEQQNELRKAVTWIEHDLLESGGAVVDIPANGTWYTTISFKKAVGVTNGSIDWSTNNISYGLSGTNPILLQRVSGAVTRIVALNIDLLQFRRQSATPDVVEVNLRAKNSNLLNKWANLQTTLSFKVQMRN